MKHIRYMDIFCSDKSKNEPDEQPDEKVKKKKKKKDKERDREQKLEWMLLFYDSTLKLLCKLE